VITFLGASIAIFGGLKVYQRYTKSSNDLEERLLQFKSSADYVKLNDDFTKSILTNVQKRDITSKKVVNFSLKKKGASPA